MREAMRYRELMRAIRQKQFAPIYYFTGAEKTIAQMMENQLVRATVAPGTEQLNVMTFKEKLTDVSELMAIARQLPFMSPYRVVIVREETGICHTADTHIVEPFSDYLAKPEPQTILIICDEKPDKRKRIYKALHQHATEVTFDTLSRVDLENWIAARFKRAGKRISTQTLIHLIDKIGYLEHDNINMAMVDNRVAQLIDYVGDADTVAVADVDAVVPETADDRIFRMIDLALQGQTGEVLTMLKHFYLQGESPFGVFGLLAGQLRTMLAVQVYADNGAGDQAIAKRVGRPAFAVRKMAQTGRRFGRKGLKRLINELAELDYQMKTGQVDPEAGVALFMMRLA